MDTSLANDSPSATIVPMGEGSGTVPLVFQSSRDAGAFKQVESNVMDHFGDGGGTSKIRQSLSGEKRIVKRTSSTLQEELT